MEDTRAKYKVNQILRFLNGTTTNSNSSGLSRPMNLSCSDEILRENYEQLNRLTLAHIVEKKRIGQLGLYSAGVEFQKPTVGNTGRLIRGKETRKAFRKHRTKDMLNDVDVLETSSGNQLTKLDVDILSEVGAPNKVNEQRVKDTRAHEEVNPEYLDVQCEQTCHSPVTIREVNSEDIQIRPTQYTTEAELIDDNTSLDLLFLQDTLCRSESQKISPYEYRGASNKQYHSEKHNYTSRKKSSHSNKPGTKDVKEGGDLKKTQKSKYILDDKLVTTLNEEDRQWKNKLACKKLKDERVSEKVKKEQDKATSFLESEAKYIQWIHEMKVNADLQRKIQQGIDAKYERGSADALVQSNGKSNEDRSKLCKSTPVTRQRILRGKKQRKSEEETISSETMTQKNETTDVGLPPPLVPLSKISNSIVEATQTKADETGMKPSISDVASSAIRKVNDKIKTKSTNISKGKKSKHKRYKQKLDKNPDNQKDVVYSVEKPQSPLTVTEMDRPISEVKRERRTYNAWVKIRREIVNEKKKIQQSNNMTDKVESDQLLPAIFPDQQTPPVKFGYQSLPIQDLPVAEYYGPMAWNKTEEIQDISPTTRPWSASDVNTSRISVLTTRQDARLSSAKSSQQNSEKSISLLPTKVSHTSHTKA